MTRSQSLKQESTNYFELQKQLDLHLMQLRSIILDAYLKGKADAIRDLLTYKKDHSSGQIQHGGGSEQISFVFGESSE